MPPSNPAMLLLQPSVEYETLLPSTYADNARSISHTALQPLNGYFAANIV